MDYLVTGGAGFIGSNIVRHLAASGKTVRVVDNLSSGRMSNIEGLLDRVDFREADIRDIDAVREAVAGVENVLHLAAMPSVIRSVEDPATCNEANVTGTLNLLLAARDAGVRRFVFSSSSSVYGDTPVLPKHEEMLPEPLSPYAVQKLTGEHYCRIFHQLYGFKTFCLRYFNVFGPCQNPKSQYSAVIPLFIDLFKNGKQPVVYGDGEQTRDFTFVDDIVNANICCCVAPDSAAGDVYNVARGDRISINELIATLQDIMKVDIKPLYVDPRPGDVKDSQADSSKAERVLKWRSGTTFAEGLARTVEHFMNIA